MEPVVAWFEWSRALAFRFHKLAANYLTLWIITTAQFLLRNLGIRASLAS